MTKIVLASGSPRRKELLAQIGLDFDVQVSFVDEQITKTKPDEIVCELSMQKAQAVFDNILTEDVIVIGADTIVYNDGKILGKPKDEADARQMIAGLSGNTHQVYTGVSCIWNGGSFQFAEKTDVVVYEMTPEEIADYIHTPEPYDKAGAYGIQGAFAAYVKKIDGDYNNVVGLPVARLYHMLKEYELI